MEYSPEHLEYAVDNFEERIAESDLDIEMEMGLPHENNAHFPMIIFGFAVVKDFILDPLILALTLIFFPLGWTFGMMIGIIYALVYMMWFLNKSNFMRRMMTKWFLRRVLAVVIIAAIPGARFIIPELTILVLLAHYREKKLVQVFNKTIEGVRAFR